MADFDPYGMLAGNPYLAMPRPEPPDKLAVIGQMLTGLGAGIGQAQAQGMPWSAGIGPGAAMATSAIGNARRQSEQEAMRRWQMGLMAQSAQDKRAEMARKAALAERDAAMGNDIATMVGFNVQPNPVRMGPDSYDTRLAGYEGGAKNGGMVFNELGSGAFGPYQFMQPTWDTVRAKAPDLNLPADMTRATREQHDAAAQRLKVMNGEALSSAGIPVTPANLYLAHRFGSGGAQSVIKSDPNRLLSEVLPIDWQRQNPDMRGQTAGGFIRLANERMRGVDGGGSPAAQGDSAAISPSAIASLPAEVRAGIAIMARRDPEKAVQLMVQAIQNQKKEDAYTTLSPESAKMFGLDPSKSWQRNRVTGKIEQVGGSQVQIDMGGKLMPGQKKVDEKFADDYVEFVSGGGFADSVKMLNQLQEVQKALKSGAKLSGPITGMLGDTALSFANPDAMAVRDAVFEVAQRNLRLVLGAQFTAKEGEQLIARVYNPRLSEAENAKRVDRLMDQIKTAMEAKIDSARYFEEHGTLRGWKGKLPSMADFEPAKVPETATPKADRPPISSFGRDVPPPTPAPANRPPLSSFGR